MEHTIITKIESMVVTYGFNAVRALIILIIGLLIASLVKNLVFKALTKAKIEKTLTKFLSNTAKALIYVVTAIAVLNRLGVQTGSLIAVLGAIGLAVSLAFKDSLSNLASGVLIIIHKPFKIDDFISVNGVSGTVHDLNIFVTTLITTNNETIYVPNNKLTTDFITNYSQQKIRRLELTVGVGYKDDTDTVKKITHQVLLNNPMVLKDPEPVVAVKALSDSSVDFVIRAWAKKQDYAALNLVLYEQIKNAFDHHEISIPFPQQEIHVVHQDIPGVTDKP